MKTLKNASLVIVTALAAMTGIAYGVQPPNVVDSDASLNTAMGTSALIGLTTGSYNTASGGYVLFQLTTGSQNTASGYAALGYTTSGNNNSAFGYSGLLYNSTGHENTASGAFALYTNMGGVENTASGYQALYSNTEGNANTASGVNALLNNTTGRNNVAIGKAALLDNSLGRNNIAIGWYAGRHTNGNDNILLAHKGVADESQTMRLGVKGTRNVAGSGVIRTFIAGIKGVTTGLAGSQVLIDANGQLGTISSSRALKEDIQPMGTASERLLALRPVTFKYKQASEDGSKPIQFGLIAEEVTVQFPELVIYNKEGKPETVAYHLLASLLLNEFQKEHGLAQAQAARIAKLETQSAELAQLKQQVSAMAEAMGKLEAARMVASTH